MKIIVICTRTAWNTKTYGGIRANAYGKIGGKGEKERVNEEKAFDQRKTRIKTNRYAPRKPYYVYE